MCVYVCDPETQDPTNTHTNTPRVRRYTIIHTRSIACALFVIAHIYNIYRRAHVVWNAHTAWHRFYVIFFTFRWRAHAIYLAAKLFRCELSARETLMTIYGSRDGCAGHLWRRAKRSRGFWLFAPAVKRRRYGESQRADQLWRWARVRWLKSQNESETLYKCTSCIRFSLVARIGIWRIKINQILVTIVLLRCMQIIIFPASLVNNIIYYKMSPLYVHLKNIYLQFRLQITQRVRPFASPSI